MTKNLMKMAMAVMSTVGGFAIMSNAASAAVKHPTPKLTIRVGKSTISATGGAVTVRVTERNVTNCQWLSTPKLKGFDKKVKCAAKMSRVAHIPSTLSGTSYKVTMSAKSGMHKVSKSATVVEAGLPVTIVAPPPVSTAPVPSTTSTSLAVHLDPTFVQSANNPLAVTYQASATASQEVGLQPSQQLASLPQGVLDFYSDGNLACSTNVGGTTTTTSCPVTYTSLGAHSVVTEYISGTNSVTETDVEDITGQDTVTTVAFSGDPTQGSTLSTLTAIVTSQLGTDTTPAAGTIKFNVDNAVLTTLQNDQTTCTIDWTSAPTFVQGDGAYVATATSPDCTVTGTVLKNISELQYTATFAGTTGLTASTSQQATLNDWPQVPPVEYVTGTDYNVTWGGVSLVQLDVGQYNLTTSATTDETGGTPNYFIRVQDDNGNVIALLGPDAGGNTQTINDSEPLPLGLTFTFVPANDPQTTTWVGAQEIVTTYGFANTIVSGTFNI